MRRLIRALYAWSMKCLCLHMAIGLLIATSAVAADAAVTQPESRVKAAFLFKFLGYVDWPNGTFNHQGAPLIIGVIEADEIAGELSHIVTGRSVDNRPLVVKRLGAGDPVAGTHVLFIGTRADGKVDRVFGPVKSLLTVTETDEAALAGIINFVLINNQVRFDVSLGAAERNDLRISARLLSVAHRVLPATP